MGWTSGTTAVLGKHHLENNRAEPLYHKLKCMRFEYVLRTKRSLRTYQIVLFFCKCVDNWAMLSGGLGWVDVV